MSGSWVATVDDIRALKEASKSESARYAATEDDREALILGCINDIGGVVAHYFRDIHDREEMIQDIVTKLIDKFSSFEGRSPFKHWALAISSRMCISKLRRKKIVSFFSLSSENAPEPPSEQADPLESTEKADKKQILRDCVELLKPNDREVITLCDLMQKKDEEVADILGVSQGNLRVKRHRARKNLKILLEKKGYEHG